MREIVTADEIATRLDVPIGTVHSWRSRGKMPAPRYETVNGRPARPLWDWAEVAAWAVRTGRLDLYTLP